jgi:hypothetical protein
MSETPKKAPKPRPTLRTPAVEDQILQAIANGTPLAQVCREPGMPHPSTWYTWCDADDELDRRFVRARDHGAHAIATEALELADGVAVHGESIQKAKLQIETRLKLLAKWSPKLYGEQSKMALTGADGGAIKTEAVGVSNDAMRELTEVLLQQAADRAKGA